MPHIYEVHLDNGRAYEVPTNQHHDGHPQEAFHRHLVDILKTVIGGLALDQVRRVVYKGRR